MEKLGPALCCLMLILVSWIVTSPAAGQIGAQEDILNDKEKKVRLLAHHALFLQLAAELSDCGLSNCVDKRSRHSCSPAQKDRFTCVQAPRDFTDCRSAGNGGVFGLEGGLHRKRLCADYSNLSPELTRAICSQSNFQFPANRETIFTELTFWNYFGSAEGAWRVYPGREADSYKGCIEYITAVSIVKDLVVQLETGH